ncbi:alpha/beta fold hydrolase [Deinococcus ruber]|uniref:Proline iminopeptidase n=1 Tax=Deinococcus ruber TaxID=1848197 RepID=A0A918C6S7_9DEIO|nr:alpha/beta hydrolase [Deinococcus ruber]GGR07598.1 proline iminopeptidase [Deinococcus ruber]
MLQDQEALISLGNVRQWVRVAGTVHATVPLVVLHGGPGGNHWVFERTAGRLLEQHRTVVYYEQRGCGRSEAAEDPSADSYHVLIEDVLALIDWLGVPAVDLLGYSFGGGLALEVARVNPQRIRHVVVQAPAFHLADPEIAKSQIAGLTWAARGETADRIRRLDVPDLDRRLDAIWSLVDIETVDRFLFQDTEHARRNRSGWAESGLVNTGDLARALSQQPPPAVADHLPDIQRPVLVVSGRHDRNVPLSFTQQVAEQLPWAKLVVFEHSAHFPDIEETETFVETVLTFLESPMG